MRYAMLSLALLLGAGCSEPQKSHDLETISWSGTWRAVLDSPGGELPFTLRITDSGDGSAELSAQLVNGPEVLPLDRAVAEGRELALYFDRYDSAIHGTLNAKGELAGEWKKTVPEGYSRLPFRARRSSEQRFSPLEDAVSIAGVGEIEGQWEVEFKDDDGTEPALGEFHWQGDELLGTFLTPTGDYRFLAGDFSAGRLRLSTFDGAHAFLFDAALAADGTLEGDFWSRDTYHATWTARRLTADAETALPSPWELAHATHPEGLFRFAFPDLQGEIVQHDDPRFAGKALLVNIFGSWCPNCNDEAPLLGEWHRRYRDQGLEVVGLAYEFTGDFERDARLVGRYKERHRIDFPLLIAGTSDKTDAADTLPDLDAVIAYPTTVFIGRDGRVRRVHSGFSGPGTGTHHDELKLEIEQLIEDLLSEPSPAG